MRQRTITGLLGSTLFLLMMWIGGWWYTAFLFLISVMAYVEFCKMRKRKWQYHQLLPGLLFIAWVFEMGLTEQQVISVPTVHSPFHLLIVFILLNLCILFSNNRFNLNDLAYLLVGALYVGYGFSYMMQAIWRPGGFFLSLFVIMVIWATDVGAYLVGRRFGRRKLWPEISPKKTWEGALAGTALGVLVSLIFSYTMPYIGSVHTTIGLGFLIACVGQMGDLMESSWKRTFLVKDSGTVLPGHGGILDRFDSLLLTFIVLYVLGVL